MKDSEKIVHGVDEMLFNERVQRYEFLSSQVKPIGLPIGFRSGFISVEYFAEAKRCWLYGLFVPTIIMMQLAFQEGLRFVFGSYENINLIFDESRNENEMGDVNKMGFKMLINFATKKKLH